jgi:hypothetical protein
METPRPLPSKLREIDKVILEDLATSEPVTIEQATAILTETVIDPNTMGEAISLTLEEPRSRTVWEI